MAVTRRHIGDIVWTHVAIEIDAENFLEGFKSHLLSHVRPNWSPSGTRAKVFNDGFTNKLVGLYHEDGPKDDMVLMRINGPGTETFIDRDAELISTHLLHRAGLAAPVYLQFDNGTCYGYLPGRTVHVSEMGDRAVLGRVAKTMAKLHATEPPPASHSRALPFVWAKCDDWISKVPQTFEDPKKNETFQRVIGTLDTLRTQYQWLRGVLRDCRSPQVFCHNDLLCGNLIYNEDSGAVTFIDFEYADVNYSAYDIGNYFCEFSGFVNPDYSRYPDEKTQKLFIRFYLEEAKIIRRDGSSVSDDDVHSLYTEANRFALASHMLWTLWALFQALYSQKDFDYVA
ncbi:hypothetical protein EMCRGX_G009871 [Ephydatia muelleri]